MHGLLVAVAAVLSTAAPASSQSSWPTPSPAQLTSSEVLYANDNTQLSIGETMFKKVADHGCSGRNEICNRTTSPCKETSTSLKRCRELCASVYECTSFEWVTDSSETHRCSISSSCIEAYMAPESGKDLYLKEPPPDPHYPGLVSPDLGQVAKLGPHSCYQDRLPFNSGEKNPFALHPCM